MNTVRGLMFIGDPHLESRVPGFRKDNFPEVALEKFRWSLAYALNNNLQPFLLGDLFQLPQDNPNWLVSSVIEIIDQTLGEPLPSIYGNHDVRENTLKPNDSIHILFKSGHLRLLDEQSPWTGMIKTSTEVTRVIVGGTAWGQKLPKSFERSTAEDEANLVCWITHHDILIPGYEEGGRIRPKELEGIDLVVNGHIHRRLETVSKGSTHWMTPGNITRRTRSDATKNRVPAVLVVSPAANSATQNAESGQQFRFSTATRQEWLASWLTIPHQPFDDVFHPEVESEEIDGEPESGFIANLKELTARRTSDGAGLEVFLQQNLSQFDPEVATQIAGLAKEAAGIELKIESPTETESMKPQQLF